MPVNTTLTDSEGFTWDIESNAFGTNELGIADGATDTFDGAMRLIVNGISINPQNASVDGREVNAQPLLLANGIAVQRSILVSDAAISPIGFARFLDSFTNTTDAAITITVETRTNSGADENITIPNTSDGVPGLTAADVGFVTTDGATNSDSVAMIVYGDGEAGSLAPTSATVNGDIITITHTLTLQPGETQSLLQFATQNAAGSEILAGLDLNTFTNPAVNLDASGFLAGLSREEQLTIVNYSGFDTVQDSFILVDSDGNRWGVDTLGRLSTLDSDALLQFQNNVFHPNYDETVSITQDAETGSVTVVTGGFEADPLSTVTYTYTPLEGQGVIRLVVTWSSTVIINGTSGMNNSVTTGANPVLVPAQVNSADFGVASGAILDDSESGYGGTLPALTFVHGATAANNSVNFGGNAYTQTQSGFSVVPGQPTTFLFFFALNDTGFDALADLARLNNPGPEELIGLSAEQVAGFRNFGLDETDRLQVTTGDSNDNVIDGHHWGDNINGDAGDDTISAGASDDLVNGGDGLDDIDGGDGNDILAGGAKDDLVSGGNGNDTITGDDGNDLLLGEAGDDTIAGGVGNDTIRGNIGVDTLQGDAGIDTLNGGHGDDDLFGGSENDRLAGGKGADDLFGEDGNDTLNGGLDADRMLGGAGNDQYFVDNTLDRVFETTTFASNINAGGIDTVNSSITFNLDLYASVRFAEHLTLTGTAAINGTGNNLGNRIAGNSGANQLNGGLGNDTLIGGLGADRFVFNTALGNTNIDRISDFEDGVDKIRLDDAIFVGLDVANVLDPNAFVANASGQAENTSQHIIYETDTGRLFYDVDGLNGVARVQFGTMGIGLAIDNTDFQVV